MAFCKNAGTRLKTSDWDAGMKGGAFHRLGLPDKLDHFERKHHIALDKDLRRHVVSVNAARNCLVHRGGVVGPADLDDQGALNVEWRKLHTFLQDEDGEHELVLGQRIEKESWLCARVIDGKKTFSLGERLSVSTQEFADITWGLFAFGNDLVQRISAFGETKGYLTSAPQPEASPPDLPSDGPTVCSASVESQV